MTTAESPPPRQPETPQSPETGERYNLAARVYGDGHDSTTDAQAAENGDGRAPDPYNLAARVYGDGRAPGPDGSGDAAPGAAVAGAAPAAAVSPPRPPGPPAAVAADRAAEGQPRGRRMSLRTLDSLRVPAFRWYFLAQFGTFGAMNMQMLVNGYLVFTLTGSFAALGTVALARSVPGIGLSMVGGVLADRFPRKYLVQIGQFMSAVIAIGVGLLLLFDMPAIRAPAGELGPTGRDHVADDAGTAVDAAGAGGHGPSPERRRAGHGRDEHHAHGRPGAGRIHAGGGGRGVRLLPDDRALPLLSGDVRQGPDRRHPRADRGGQPGGAPSDGCTRHGTWRPAGAVSGSGTSWMASGTWCAPARSGCCWPSTSSSCWSRCRTK